VIEVWACIDDLSGYRPRLHQKQREHKSMTGYTVHTGASKKFVAGWDHIFTDGKSAKKKTKKKAAKKKAASKPTSKKKAPVKKKAAKKKSKR